MTPEVSTLVSIARGRIDSAMNELEIIGAEQFGHGALGLALIKREIFTPEFHNICTDLTRRASERRVMIRAQHSAARNAA